jgi:hypothetical protein
MMDLDRTCAFTWIAKGGRLQLWRLHHLTHIYKVRVPFAPSDARRWASPANHKFLDMCSPVATILP